MRPTRKRLTAAVCTVATVSLIAACGSSSSGGGSSAASGKVTLSVVSLIPGSEKSAFDAFNKQVAIFEKANPNIIVQPKEYQWTGPTFAAQLAGGTLPIVFEVPFTDGKALIQRGQLADITTQVKTLPYADKINPTVLSEMQDAKGNIYGLPKGAYGIGLQINRDLFTRAGLNPDKPPTTWDEIRADAKTIAQKTGQAGYAEMTKSNTGGWMLTTLTYALGGRMETGAGTATKATVNNPQTKQALQMLHDMRWTDNSMGANFLYDWSGINQAFAAGKIGMYMGGSDVYSSLVQQDKIQPATYGLAQLPLSSDPNAGLLGGGTIAVVSPKASDAQKAAAVKWIDYYYESKLTNQDSAVLDAKTLAASNQPVGVPALPLFNKQELDTYNGWIKPYVNVPLAQMTSFTDGVFSQTLVPEPAAHTQDLYAALDSVVQAVLTTKDANIDSLLNQANTSVQALLDKG
jgi:multiple sugar transport system substrate-binding protein